jgi:hypothetical protein
MNFFNICLLCYFLNDLFKYRFPDEYLYSKTFVKFYFNEIVQILEPYLIFLLVKLLYIYSCSEIKFKTYCLPIIKKYLNNINNNTNNTISSVYYYNSNFECTNEINTSSKLEWLIQNLCKVKAEEYNYIILYEFNNKKYLLENGKNKYKYNNLNTFSNHFLSVCVVIPNQEPINIELKTETWNFYIVGNKIDYIFINHFFKNVLKIVNNPIDNYILEIIDNNVNSLILDKNKYIYFEDEITYKILEYVNDSE